MKWGETKTLYKFPVEIGEPPKSLWLFGILWRKQFPDSRHLLQMHLDSPLGENEAQKGHQGRVEFSVLYLH